MKSMYLHLPVLHLQDTHVVIFSVVAHNLRPSVSSIDSDEGDLVTLCQQCWSADQDRRPEAAVILSQLKSLDRCAGERQLHSKSAKTTNVPQMERL